MVRAARLALDAMSPETRASASRSSSWETRPRTSAPTTSRSAGSSPRRWGSADRFRMLGFRADVRPLVADFDVAVVPSVYADPLPRAVIESMAMGKPVVAFAVGGVVEMLDDARRASSSRSSRPTGAKRGRARRRSPGSPTPFVRYAGDPALRARQGAAARERVLRDFDARAHARRIQREIVLAAGFASAP